MPPVVRNILFLCTANSARSILAEAIVNNLPACRGKFIGFSAGSFPGGRVNPFALQVLREHDHVVTGLRSKSWSEFAGADAPAISFVITVCDRAAGESCPIWPGHPATAHWGVADPAAAGGDDEQRRAAFEQAFVVLRRRIEAFAALPFDTLDKSALQQHLDEIGRL